jgi:hypothetical protein
VIKSGKSVTVHVHVTLLMTTNIERKIKFDVEGLGSHLITIKLVGELSTKLDPDDIITTNPPIGTCHSLPSSLSLQPSVSEALVNTCEHTRTERNTHNQFSLSLCHCVFSFIRARIVRNGVQGQLPGPGGGGQGAQLADGQAPAGRVPKVRFPCPLFSLFFSWLPQPMQFLWC